MKSKHKKVLLLLLLVLITLASMGCTIGIKEKNNLVIATPLPIPEAARGVPLIATDEEIPLVILNEEDKIFKKKIGGYVVVDPNFYALLIKAYNSYDFGEE